MARANTLSGGRKIWMPAVENFLLNLMGESFTEKEIIDQATLTTKTYCTYKGDRAKYNGKHVREDKTMIKLVDSKACPSTAALSQSLRGKKEVGKWFDEQNRLTQYFWRVVDEK